MFWNYLIIINAIGILIYLINMWLYLHKTRWRADILLTIVSLLGGAFGIIIAIILFDRKANKENMMSRVLAACICVMQMVFILLVQGHHADIITFSFWDFFNEHRWILVYLAIINIITFIFFAVDKVKAIGNKKRVRIVTLLGLAFLGGSLGGLLAMYLLRHKIRKDYFAIGIPLIIAMQIVVVFYIMNAGW